MSSVFVLGGFPCATAGPGGLGSMRQATPQEEETRLQALRSREERHSSRAPDSVPSDESLMQAYVGGDTGAFRLLFDRYAKTIFAVMVKRGLSDDDARDLVQQTFLKAHQARHDFDSSLRLRPWLWTIAFNLLRDGWRRRRSQVAKTAALLQQVEAAEQLQPAGSDREQERAVRRAILELGPAQQEVILLHWYQGMTFREIADAVGATETAVKVRAHRAYGELRQLLKSLQEASA